MKPKIDLNEIPDEIKNFRVLAEQRIAAADDGLERLKVFADCWREEQDLWAKAYPERAEAFNAMLGT